MRTLVAGRFGQPSGRAATGGLGTKADGRGIVRRRTITRMAIVGKRGRPAGPQINGLQPVAAPPQSTDPRLNPADRRPT